MIRVMTKGAFLRWLENRYLERYLHGHGMEIGALWRRFPVPPKAHVWYVDRLSRAGLQLHYPELKGDIVPPDLLAEATQLPVPPASLDFLIASHVLEHLPFPLMALRSWYEALARGGVLLLKIPDMRYTFDVHRARTSLAHLLQEHDHPERFDNRAHYAEWVEKVGGHDPSSPGFEATVEHLMEQNHSIHFHAWIDQDVRELVRFTQQTWRLEWKPVVFWGARFYRKEITLLLLRKL
jgi:predicted SAM-dependent methyltransferase